MTDIAFCGLGQMGAPMAARLLGSGHRLTVWNRTPERAAPLVAQGARLADSPAAAAGGARIVVTMLAGPSALGDVVFGPDGIATGVSPGATLVDMSTVGPGAVRDVASRLPEGVDMLDAPVLGSVPQATEGSLKVFVGGEVGVFGRCRAVLGAMGHPTHLGPIGAGASMKLVANSTLGALMCGLAEAMALADAFGLEQADVLDILAGSPIGATANSKRSLIEGDRFLPPNFKLSLAAKDLGLVTDAAAAAGIDLRVARASEAWFEQAMAAGLGDRDYSAVVSAARHRPTGSA